MTMARQMAWLWASSALIVSSASASAQEEDWRYWRGPTRNAVAEPGQTPPTRWDESTNVVWKAPVPGRGHSSPIVVGRRVFLTTAEEEQQVQSVLCFDRKTGELLWKTDVNHGGFLTEIHAKNTQASPTPSSDGELVYAVFANHDRVQLVAVDLEGEIRWQTTAGPFQPKKYRFGYGPSPLLLDDRIVVASEFDGAGFLAAFDKRSGDKIWSVPREFVSYSSPIVATVGGREQILLSGGDTVTSFHPGDGQILWSCAATTAATGGTVVWEDDLVFASGGFPKKGTYAIRADGSGDVVWQNGESATSSPCSFTTATCTP